MGHHYLDGLFWGVVFTLLSVMMVYKYWDSITKEDLEFSVGGKTNVWEIKDPMINDEEMMALAEEHYKLKQQVLGNRNNQQNVYIYKEKMTFFLILQINFNYHVLKYNNDIYKKKRYNIFIFLYITILYLIIKYI